MPHHPLPHPWAHVLDRQGLDRAAIESVVARAYINPANTWPPEAAVFRAFELTPVDRVRVFIIGQDPYPTASNATGVAFSTGPQGMVTDALTAIYTNLARDPAFVTPQHGDLSEWAARGALLLNASLTLDSDPTSLGRRGTLWKPLLRATLAAVSATCRPIPVVLLGGKAFDLRGSVGDPTAIKAAGHPTPHNRTVRRFPLFEAARPFEEANDYLVAHGEPKFDWSVP